MAVLNDEPEIVFEQIQSAVFVAIDFFLHRREVHGVGDEFVIRWNLNTANRLKLR